ncbi:hypothetical protein RclHR1_24530003 [Rhizophagus clarus]|uniref:Uncharacterized protein n=1 Tax=Rhizophagus clarus TaxID=94130 RepID=A0A2Z6RBD8_9GLOM|nr:hypothetical protein RclHR1_24530003 [Rhizophagus clarus]
MKLDSRNYVSRKGGWVPDEYYEPDLRVEVPDEYYELDLGIEVSGEGEGFQMNNMNWTLEFRVPDEYYELDFRIEVSGGG